MVFLITNITDSTNDPKTVSIGDVANRMIVEIAPGETIDLERFSTRNQILDSLHIKVHLNEGRITVDTLGSAPRERIFVDAALSAGAINVGSVTLDEPIQISANVGGSEVALTGTQFGATIALDTNPVLADFPQIDELFLDNANTPETYTLPTNTRKFMVYLEEGDAPLFMSVTSGGSSITIGCGSNYSVDDVNADSLTLYFETPEDAKTVKIFSWAVS